MPDSLPPRPNKEYLRSLAAQRLRNMRRSDPAAKYADALRDVAGQFGCPSWRALMERVDIFHHARNELRLALDLGELEHLRAKMRKGWLATCLVVAEASQYEIEKLLQL